MSGKRGQPGRLRKLTLKERAKKLERDVRRDREGKIMARFKTIPGQPKPKPTRRRATRHG
jgi:hypothetical protein